MDLENGNRTSKNSEIVLDASGGSKHPETPKVVHESDSNRHSTILPPEASASEGDLRVPSRKLISLSSLSSVASDSSFEDLFQVDTNRIATSTHIPFLPKHHDFSSLGPASISRASDVTHGLMGHGISPTESPSIQMMERCGGYDPYRIPSSVFARSKSNKELEWSVASNESLFSIHLGNNSFSRDHVFLLSDLGKSGELTKSGELFALGPPPPAPVVEIESNIIEEVRESGGGGVADETIKDTARTNPEDQCEGRVPPSPTVFLKCPSLSRRSDGSGASTRSFAFPILADGMKNSVKVMQHTEEECLEPPSAPKILTKKVTKPKATYWFRCFSWCKWGCTCRRHRCSCCCC